MDSVANPKAREILIKRANILRTIRNYLDERGFIEVETPILQPIPGAPPPGRSSPTTTSLTATFICASRPSFT